ncbi:MAG: hypothetical protein AAFX03_11340 [Pseudomonadota bacterium]
MYRRTVSILTVLYAIAFAFAAMAVIRWPSLMMVLGFITGVHEEGVDWRKIGIFYSVPYLVAALCFYASAAMVAGRRKGGFAWFVFGALAGFPCVYFVDFHPGWWLEPTLFEATVLLAGALTFLLGWAVWDLRLRKRKRQPAADPAQDPRLTLLQALELAPQPEETKPRRRRAPSPPSAAILRQQESFAREGRKMLARQRRAS